MENAVFRPCVLIPVYNHEHAIFDVVTRVLVHRIHCILVDDGSHTACAEKLHELASANAGQLSLVTHDRNRGKGAAVMTGFKHAARLGFTHVLQIDADGQHDTNDIPVFLDAARFNPDSLITGYPLYDRSVPAVRLYCRYLTHIWVWINTLSFQIKDSMCGLRVYPVSSVLKLINKHRPGARMTFDTDIIVRLFWEGTNVLNLPTKVTYPADGISHFRPFADNVQISFMHTRLFFGMLIRIPRLLRLKWNRS